MQLLPRPAPLSHNDYVASMDPGDRGAPFLMALAGAAFKEVGDCAHPHADPHNAVAQEHWHTDCRIPRTDTRGGAASHMQHVSRTPRDTIDLVHLQTSSFLAFLPPKPPATALPPPQARARCGQLLACCGHPDVAAGWVRPLERLAGVNAVAAGVLAAKLAAGEKVGELGGA